MSKGATSRPSSFRTKITAWNVIISGLVLAAVLAAFLIVTWRIGLDRVDREVLAIGQNALRTSHPTSFWDQFGSSLQTVMGEERAHQWFISVRSKSGAVISETSECPEPFLAAARAWGERHTHPNPPALEKELQKKARPHFAAIDDAGRDLDPGQRDQLKEDVMLMVELGMEGFEIESSLRRLLRDMGAIDAWRARASGPQAPRRQGGRRPRLLHPEAAEFAFVTMNGDPYRVGHMANEEVNMLLAAPLVAFNAENKRYRIASLFGFFGALGLLAFGGRILAGRALHSVELIAETLDQVSTRELDQRITHLQTDQEFQRLVEGINGMLERLERGFNQASRFSADAAHELNTPLTVLQGEVESLLHQEEEGSPQQLAFSALLEEVQRLKAVTHNLLLLAKADAGKLPVDKQQVWFSDIVAAAMEDAEVLAGDLYLETEIEPGLTVGGDETMLRQVVNNLMTNAIKYNCTGGYIRVRLESGEDEVRLEVKNPGENLAEMDIEKIFERFYRADASRKREGFGSGLGLSLSREIVLAHDGSLEASVHEDEITFTLALPRESPPA